MYVFLILLLIAAFFGPFALLRLVSGLGCLVLLAIGALWLASLWFSNLPGMKESNPRPVATQHEYNNVANGVWIRTPDGRVWQKRTDN